MVQSPISGQFSPIHDGTGPGDTETRLGGDSSDVMAPHYYNNSTIGLKNTLQMSAKTVHLQLVLSEIIF